MNPRGESIILEEYIVAPANELISNKEAGKDCIKLERFVRPWCKESIICWNRTSSSSAVLKVLLPHVALAAFIEAFVTLTLLVFCLYHMPFSHLYQLSHKHQVSLFFFIIFLLKENADLQIFHVADLLDLKTGYFNLRQIKAATNDFDPANKIGEGGFGSVFKVTEMETQEMETQLTMLQESIHGLLRCFNKKTC